MLIECCFLQRQIESQKALNVHRRNAFSVGETIGLFVYWHYFIYWHYWSDQCTPKTDPQGRSDLPKNNKLCWGYPTEDHEVEIVSTKKLFLLSEITNSTIYTWRNKIEPNQSTSRKNGNKTLTNTFPTTDIFWQLFFEKSQVEQK